MATDRRAASPQGIVLAAINEKNGTSLTLNDVQLKHLGGDEIAGMYSTEVLGIATNKLVNKQVVNHRKINLSSVLIETTFISVTGLTYHDLLVAINAANNSFITAEDVTLNGVVPSAARRLNLNGTDYTWIHVMATPGSMAYAGEVTLRAKLDGPLLYPDPVPMVYGDNPNYQFVTNTDEPISGNSNQLVLKDGTRAVSAPFAGRVETNWTPDMGVSANLYMSHTELDPANAGPLVNVGSFTLHLNMTLQWRKHNVTDGGGATREVESSILTASFSYPQGFNRLAFQQYIQEISRPQALLYLELFEGGNTNGDPVIALQGFTTMADDVVAGLNIFFMATHQTGMATGNEWLIGENIGMGAIHGVRIVDGKEYHKTLNGTVCGPIYPEQLAPIDWDGNDNKALGTHYMSAPSPSDARLSPANLTMPIDTLNGQTIPRLATGGEWKPSQGVQREITFPDWPRLRASWIHYGEWDNTDTRILQIAFLHEYSPYYDPNGDTQNAHLIVDLWRDITNALKAAPDWNPDIGVVACLIASDFGVMDVSRTLFNPRIVGNAVVFEGKIEYGNRPGLRTYSNIPDRIAIANAKYYPN